MTASADPPALAIFVEDGQIIMVRTHGGADVGDVRSLPDFSPPSLVGESVMELLGLAFPSSLEAPPDAFLAWLGFAEQFVERDDMAVFDEETTQAFLEPDLLTKIQEQYNAPTVERFQRVLGAITASQTPP